MHGLSEGGRGNGSISGIVVLLFEWPVSGVAKLGTMNDNLWVRGIVYIL